jgi:hypothetical protein
MNEVMRTEIERCSTCTAEVVLRRCVPCVPEKSRANGSIRSRRSALVAVRLYPLLSILALFTLCSRTEAITYTYKMRGVIDELVDSENLFDDSLGIGSSYAGLLSISPGVPFSPGYYEDAFLNAIGYYPVVLGGVDRFGTLPQDNEVFIGNSPSGGGSDSFVFIGGFVGNDLDFTLTDPSGTALHNLSLPTSMDIADWSTTSWIVDLHGAEGPNFARGHFTYIAAAVPETSDTLGLLTIGLLALTAIARGTGKSFRDTG